jgi:hypothetical protein
MPTEQPLAPKAARRSYAKKTAWISAQNARPGARKMRAPQDPAPAKAPKAADASGGGLRSLRDLQKHPVG